MVCCPFGPVVLLPIFFSIIGVGLTLTSTFSCHLFDSTGADSLGMNRGYGPWTIEGTYPIYLGGKVFTSLIASNETFGDITLSGVTNAVNNAANAAENDVQKLLSENNTQDSYVFDVNEICYPWTQFGYATYPELFDTEMHVARGFSMAAVVLSIIMMFVLMFMGCTSFHPTGFYVSGFLCILTGLFSAVTMISFKSSYCQDADTCKLGYSGIVCIVAAGLWVLIGLFLFCMNKTQRNARRRPSVSPNQPKTYDRPTATAPTVVTTAAGRDVEGGGHTSTVVY